MLPLRKEFWLLVLLGWCSLTACQEERSVRFDHPEHRYDTAGARLAVGLPALETVRDDFLGLVVNLEGMEGLLALIEGAIGLDFANLDLLSEAGLDGAMPGTVFTWRDGIVLSLGLADRSRFETYFDGLCAGEAWSFGRVETPRGPLYDMAGVALALEGNLLTLYWGDNARAHLAALLLAPAPDGTATTSEGYRLTWRAQDARLEDQLEGQYETLGPLAGIMRALARFVDGCDGVTGTLSMGDRLSLSAEASGCRAGLTGTAKMAPESQMVDDGILLVQWVLGESSLWGSIPGVFRHLASLWWRDLPGKRPEGFEELGPLLNRFEGEIALGFLGLGADANLDTFTGSKDALAPLFGIHWQLNLLLRESETLDELFDPEVMKRLLPQYEAQGLGAGDILATEYCRPKTQKAARRCFALARQGQVLIAVTGIGEGERLVRTLRGQRPPLAKSLFVTQNRGPLTVTLKTRRLVKDLMSKGFPPYFLQILSSVLEVRLTVGDAQEGTAVTMEVVLR